MALKKGADAPSFTFLRTWTIPRTVFNLFSGNIALADVTFLVAEDAIACEELIIGLPVLRHLKVDTRTLLENNRSKLDGQDCSAVGNPTMSSKGGVLSLMITARLNGVANEMSETVWNDRPRVNYFSVRTEADPFPDPSLLDPIDSEKHEDILQGVKDMKDTAKKNGLEPDSANSLERLINTNIDVFRNGFSSGPPSKIRPLRIELMPEAKKIRVHLLNYTQEQNEFLKSMVEDLIRHGMEY